MDELDAIVVEGIVRGTDDDAEGAVMLGGEHGHGGGGQHASEHGVHAYAVQSSDQGGFQHLARGTGVTTDQHARTLATAGLAQHHRRSLRQAQDKGRGHGVTVGNGTHAVGAEELALFRRHRTRGLA